MGSVELSNVETRPDERIKRGMLEILAALRDHFRWMLRLTYFSFSFSFLSFLFPP